MNESLYQAKQDVDSLIANLKASLSQSSELESIVILPMIKQAAELKQQIARLIWATGK